MKIKNKACVYARIKDEKIDRFAEEYGLISVEEDPNIMNPIVMFVRLLGADSVYDEELLISSEKEEDSKVEILTSQDEKAIYDDKE